MRPPKVPDAPMTNEAWNEYSFLLRRLEWMGWRWSSIYKFRREELLEKFADVIRDDDDIGEPNEMIREKLFSKIVRKSS